MTAPLFDLSGRAKLRITGMDRLRFLNGQVTNDVRKASESAAIEACVLSAKGKMNGHVFLSLAQDCFLADADAELREVFLARLERYVIADDVQIEDVTDRFSIFHVLGPTGPAAGDGRPLVSALRFTESGWDVWIDAGFHDIVARELSSAFRFFDTASAEVFRIEEGIPRWGRELTDEIIPIEANLEERAIDYEKGCYIGQEVISRIKMSGQTNKRLCGLVSLRDAPLLVGMKVSATGEKNKEAGWITSATRSERLGKEIALAYVKRGSNSVGARLEAIKVEDPSIIADVEIVDLPFAC